MWIDLNGSKFNIDHAFALRPVDDGDERCILFPVGASPIDGGFLIELPLSEAFEAIQQARLLELAGMLPEPELDPEQTVPDRDPD